MSTPSREFVMIVKESAFKTPLATPVVWTRTTPYGLANADAYYIRLPGDNQFTMRPRPVIVPISYGGGFAVTNCAVSDKTECRGQLTCHLSVSQAPFLLSWAGVRITGGTAPWTTSEPAGDLASCSIYHGILTFDNQIKRRVYLGCKVDSWSIACSEASTIATLTLQVSGSTPQGNSFDSSTDPTATTFPIPADANLPCDPYVWINTAGVITIGGNARAAITELTINSANSIARSFYNDRFIQYLRFLGRNTTAATRLQYNLSPDDRSMYEQLTSGSVSIEFNNTTHNFTMNMNAQNYYNPYDDDLKLADTYWTTNTSNNMYDSTAGSDFTLTFA